MKISITRSKQATPKRTPFNLRNSVRKGLSTVDSMLEPKPPTVGQQLDAMLANTNVNTTKDILEAANRLITEELAKCSN